MWPFICSVSRCMGTVLERARPELEPSLEQELAEAALRSAIENVHSRSGFRNLAIARGFPVRIVVLGAMFLISSGIAAALIHSSVERAGSLFHIAGF